MSAVRIGASDVRPTVEFLVDGVAVHAPAGECLAVSLACGGRLLLRNSPRAGAARGAFCFMGVCQECAIRVDGELRQACLTPVRSGMTVTLQGSL